MTDGNESLILFKYGDLDATHSISKHEIGFSAGDKRRFFSPVFILPDKNIYTTYGKYWNIICIRNACN